jgi:succinyl-CoA synthetase beta subunit
MLAELRQPSHEYYVAVLNDRASEGVVLVASNQGGMNIEDVAAKDPNAIITTPIPFSTGLTKETAIGVAKKLGFSSEKATDEAADIFINLYRIFKEKDATQIEINPLAETTDGAVLWFVHISFDSVGFCVTFFLSLSAVWTPSLALTITPSSARKMYSTSVTYRRRNLPRLRLKKRT